MDVWQSLSSSKNDQNKLTCIAYVSGLGVPQG